MFERRYPDDIGPLLFCGFASHGIRIHPNVKSVYMESGIADPRYFNGKLQVGDVISENEVYASTRD
jgi:hypothetical protein